MNQDALPRPNRRRSMKHLKRRHVVQDETDGLSSVQAGRHRNELALRQTDVFGVSPADRKRRDGLAWRNPGNTGADRVHDPNQIPPWCEWHSGRLGMNALTHHDVWQRDAGCQHSNTDFAVPRLRALLFEDAKRIRSAVMFNNDAPVSRGHATASSK